LKQSEIDQMRDLRRLRLVYVTTWYHVVVLDARTYRCPRISLHTRSCLSCPHSVVHMVLRAIRRSLSICLVPTASQFFLTTHWYTRPAQATSQRNDEISGDELWKSRGLTAQIMFMARDIALDCNNNQCYFRALRNSTSYIFL
jgi:hypothetical protein